MTISGGMLMQRIIRQSTRSSVCLGANSDTCQGGVETAACPASLTSVGRLLTGADVVPVGVVRAHLLVRGSLHHVAPRGQLHASGVLEVLGVCLDEVSRGDIAHGDTSWLVVRHNYLGRVDKRRSLFSCRLNGVIAP